MPFDRLLPCVLVALLFAAAARAEEADALDADDDAAAATYDELAAAPPPLPASLDAAALHAALSEAQRATVDRELRVVTFEQRQKRGEITELTGVSIGTLPHPPEAVRTLLADLAGYPEWLRMQPSYKSVRVSGSRLHAGIGSADESKAKRQMTYDVEPTPQGVLWTVVDSGTPLQAGSTLELFVAPHPALPGSSLVVHEQVGLLPPGRMLKYLTSDDKEGRNRWWKDSNRHARRLHWALEAALSHPAGAERRAAYVEHFRREFGGKAPYWAD